MTGAPRITISLGKDGFFQIWLNPAGRDLLMRELQALDERHEHFHIMPEDMGPELPVRDRPYEDGDEVIQYGKVLFRPDEWDQEYYPHVMNSSDTNAS